ncbi:MULTISPECIES: hypothetical protein [unclassified Actinopolyspora]|uniref:hypothetical protein n=1 Tax=unclassified Actinopolyspora TaxID=2639451 RepID=UPI0013F5CBCD|nr:MULTISPECIES: hypothetical protein [unclassified Actinopolyspora]NHD18129.1 hypothetical protein [Actinopolyspora sp. BKK2]NHE77194.1 hypothetical protein [Actinopolyspora sp. BKK1]
MAGPTGRTRTALAVLGWFAAAAVAVAVGLAAVSALGRGILDGGPPMTGQDEVRRELAGPAPTANDESTAESRPPASGQRDLRHTPGGTVVVNCSGGRAALLSWSPAQGFQAQDVQDGPAEEAELTFESTDTEVEITVECGDGEPLVSTEIDR